MGRPWALAFGVAMAADFARWMMHMCANMAVNMKPVFVGALGALTLGHGLWHPAGACEKTCDPPLVMMGESGDVGISC